MMKSEQIRELSPDDMKARISELEEERFRLRFRSSTETLDDPLRLRVIRKDIARIKTILAEGPNTNIKTAPKKSTPKKTKAGAVRAGGR